MKQANDSETKKRAKTKLLATKKHGTFSDIVSNDEWCRIKHISGRQEAKRYAACEKDNLYNFLPRVLEL